MRRAVVAVRQTMRLVVADVAVGDIAVVERHADSPGVLVARTDQRHMVGHLAVSGLY